MCVVFRHMGMLPALSSAESAAPALSLAPPSSTLGKFGQMLSNQARAPGLDLAVAPAPAIGDVLYDTLTPVSIPEKGSATTVNVADRWMPATSIASALEQPHEIDLHTLLQRALTTPLQSPSLTPKEDPLSQRIATAAAAATGDFPQPLPADAPAGLTSPVAPAPGLSGATTSNLPAEPAPLRTATSPDLFTPAGAALNHVQTRLVDSLTLITALPRSSPAPQPALARAGGKRLLRSGHALFRK